MTTINVKQKHIDNGKRCNTSECMVALALIEAIDFSYVSCGTTGFQCVLDGRYLRVDLPHEVGTKITAFDCQHPVSPFSFEIDIDNAMDLGEIPEQVRKKIL